MTSAPAVVTPSGLEPTPNDPTLSRLEEQIAWYDARSLRNQRLFKWLKLIEIAAAALIPVLAGLDVSVWAAGALGAVIVVLEGLQHVNQYQNNWTAYRSTCEALKHEKSTSTSPKRGRMPPRRGRSRCSPSGSRV